MNDSEARLETDFEPRNAARETLRAQAREVLCPDHGIAADISPNGDLVTCCVPFEGACIEYLGLLPTVMAGRKLVR